ncbi:MAG: hypothetical protein ACRCS3_09820 [Paracoccaceae bacterium]
MNGDAVCLLNGAAVLWGIDPRRTALPWCGFALAHWAAEVGAFGEDIWANVKGGGGIAGAGFAAGKCKQDGLCKGRKAVRQDAFGEGI